MKQRLEKNSLTPLLSGVAGEYFVAAELSARGYIASITLRNTKGVDILCSNADATKTVAIQVKTNKSSGRKWLLNEKCEKQSSNNFFYILVNLNDNKKSPEYTIVPSKILAKTVAKGHKGWMNTPGKKGQAHNVTPVRQFSDAEEKYLKRWDLLGLD